MQSSLDCVDGRRGASSAASRRGAGWPEALSARPRDALQAPRQPRRRDFGGRDSGRHPRAARGPVEGRRQEGGREGHARGVRGGGEGASLAAPAAVWAAAGQVRQAARPQGAFPEVGQRQGRQAEPGRVHRGNDTIAQGNERAWPATRPIPGGPPPGGPMWGPGGPMPGPGGPGGPGFGPGGPGGLGAGPGGPGGPMPGPAGPGGPGGAGGPGFGPGGPGGPVPVPAARCLVRADGRPRGSKAPATTTSRRWRRGSRNWKAS